MMAHIAVEEEEAEVVVVVVVVVAEEEEEVRWVHLTIRIWDTPHLESIRCWSSSSLWEYILEALIFFFFFFLFSFSFLCFFYNNGIT